MSKTIYALATINVHGTFYKAGQEIECGEGSRKSLLRLGQASETPPSEASETDDELDGTSLEVLGLSKTAQANLRKHDLSTVEQLEAFLKDAENEVDRLLELDSIKEPTAIKVLEALDDYRERNPSPDNE